MPAQIRKTELAQAELRKQHLRVLTRATWAARIWTLSVAALATSAPLFDASPLALFHFDEITYPLTGALARWDVFHFAHIARDGYTYEHDWAFMPGVPGVMRIFGALVSVLKNTAVGRTTWGTQLRWEDAVQGGALAALSCQSTATMYDLSLHHLGTPKLAYLAALLSLLPSSPATLWIGPCTEPFFTYLSYKGMLMCTQRKWVLAAFYFASATLFRANGILLCGFLLWGLAVQPALEFKQIPFLGLIRGSMLSLLAMSPFGVHQYLAYRQFCTFNDGHVPEWCGKFPPSIYSHVQEKYWNVGFLKYWTFSQIPNFLLCAPVLALLLTFSAYHLRLVWSRLRADAQRIFPLLSNPSLQPLRTLESPFTRREVTPHAIHALALGGILLFASNTQIALRFAAATPIMYWAAAWLIVDHARWGKAWVWWSVVWGAMSVTLWTVFLPPA